MKILKLLPLACTIILGAASCSDDDKEQTGFQIDDGSGFLSLDAAARSGSIAITANNSYGVSHRTRIPNGSLSRRQAEQPAGPRSASC